MNTRRKQGRVRSRRDTAAVLRSPDTPGAPPGEGWEGLTADPAARNLRAALRRLTRASFLIRSQRGPVALILLLTLVLAGLGAIEPLIMKSIVDALGRAEAVRLVLTAVGFLLAVGVVREGAAALSNWLTWRTRLRFQTDLLDLMVEKIHRLPHDVHRKEGVGALMTRLDRSIQGLVNALSEISFNTLPAYLYLAMAVTIMVRLDWRLTLAVLAFVPLPVWLAGRAAPAQRLREKTLLEKWARIYGRFNEVLSGIVTVRSFAMEDTEKRRFMKTVRQANGIVLRGVRFDSLVGSGQNLAVLAARIVCLAFGGAMVLRGEVTVGTLIAFLGYLGGLFGPVQSLTGIYRTLRTASVSVDQIFSILDTQDHIGDAPGAIDPAPVRGEIEFDRVGFGYDVSGHRVLEDIEVIARPGEVTAIVGPSGSGKSTLMSLLQRFYDPTAGAIRLDGIDLRALKQQALRRHIGVVMQDALLFNESVRAGIAYGRPGASRAEIEQAARVANAHDFIMRLEQGYETNVGERGSRFSAGERQRIAIARAVLKDPAILILDEATSALDAETEFLVQGALDRLIRGRTTFVIAHRLATVVNADQILVLKGGRIIERGRHAELMACGGYYASLVRRQTAGLLAPDFTSPHPEDPGPGGRPAAAEARVS